MTKLDYSKVPEADPARVIEVRDSGVWSGNDERPFETEAQRRRRRDQENAALFARSDRIRFNAIIKKFGEQRALEIGVPLKFLEEKRRAREQAKINRERNLAKIAARLKTTSLKKR